MAASVLLTMGHQQELLDLIVKKAKSLVPEQEGKQAMGPVIDKASLEKIERYIGEAEKGGATILLDGRGWKKSKNHGYWTGPTIILHKNLADKALHDEIFGPVISIYECKTKEECIAIENGNPYGNAACIYTTTGSTAEWFTKHFSAGMLGVNIG
jgi:malonate-semialdehyde dehydrogenase (acetylating)/methylmalonate-semialdehyde dehydrogenase